MTNHRQVAGLRWEWYLRRYYHGQQTIQYSGVLSTSFAGGFTSSTTSSLSKANKSKPASVVYSAEYANKT